MRAQQHMRCGYARHLSHNSLVARRSQALRSPFLSDTFDLTDHLMTNPMTFRQKLLSGEFALMSRAELTRVLLLVAAILATVLWVLFSVVEPPPPKRVQMLTGNSSGAYYGFAQRYAQALKKNGIELVPVQSNGSVENLQKLLSDDTPYQVALIQSGIAADVLPKWDPTDVNGNVDPPPLESLAAVAYEPVWVFYKPQAGAPKPVTFAAFKGRKIAIGPEGSGTRAVALRLLKSVAVNAGNSAFSPLSGSEAVEAVLKGEQDAVFLVASASAPSVQRALEGGLRAVSLDQADAYVRLNPWLSKISLPRGVVSMARDLPDEELTLVAASANLVVHKSLHPAISYLLMDVANEVHRAPTILNGLKEFPSEKSLEFPQSEESKRYFKTGRPVLQRYLPFWMANLVERLLVTVVPLLVLLLPAMQLIPKLMQWFGKARLLKLYDRARMVESACGSEAGQKTLALAQINALEAELEAQPPNSDLYVDTFNLRAHFDMVRSRIAAK